MPFRKRLLMILLWSLGLSAATGVLSVFLHDREMIFRVTVMGFVTAAAALLMMPMSLLADKEKTRAAGLLGMTLCVVEFLMAVGLIWSTLGWTYLDEELGLTMGFVALTGLPALGFMAIAGF